MDILAHLFWSLLSTIMCEIFHSQSTRILFMIGYSKYHCISWRQRAIWYLVKSVPSTSKSCQTYPNVVICRQIQQMMERVTRGVSAGVKGFECDIRGRNENAPTDCRGIFGAFGSHRDVVIPIVVQSVINFNNYERDYV